MLGTRLVIALAFLAASGAARAEVSKLKISRQPGLLFAPTILMEHHKLVEKHAKDAGVPGLKAAWLTLMSGSANNDALLSGNLHIDTSGVANMLLLWSTTNEAEAERGQRPRRRLGTDDASAAREA
jgi:NitT/TauT family transport system substrate-binding protein